MTNVKRSKLAQKLIPLVHQVAAQVARRVPPHVMLEDLVGAGMLGLAAAINRYDPEREETFKGYAEFRIRGEIMDELRRRDLMSRDGRAESKKVQQTIEQLTRELGCEPQHAEVAKRMGMSLSDYQTAQFRAHGARTVSLADMELAQEQRSPADLAQSSEVLGVLSGAIEQLPERQKVVLWLYYFEELPLHEIGEALNVSPSRVCQIRGEAVARLRRAMKRHAVAA